MLLFLHLSILLVILFYIWKFSNDTVKKKKVNMRKAETLKNMW